MGEVRVRGRVCRFEPECISTQSKARCTDQVNSTVEGAIRNARAIASESLTASPHDCPLRHSLGSAADPALAQHYASLDHGRSGDTASAPSSPSEVFRVGLLPTKGSRLPSIPSEPSSSCRYPPILSFLQPSTITTHHHYS
ncbi:hypothetical protein BDZ90DRAFT_160644 [Jaminaea rosea]|uniref:Uncharacterized protein n=1 Tax=Jaminaea rosea TaxID=1569628 RepID=A0A316URW1_9BASI|nr:hypothetical protein BDZ90DRAFT_160644 [Jaminaea rosea]PWN28049.1 hypothetical protein BDZ90DRAFT_160644 [Jaminaea rosea]